MYTSYRPLAFLRLVILYALFCLWVIYAGLHWRTLQQTGRQLDSLLPLSTAPAAQIPFLGITVELAGKSPAQQQARLAQLRQQGFGWVRQRFDWGEIEPVQGQFDWQASDVLIDALSVSGLTPVIVLDGSPAWARAQQDIAPTDNPFAPPADSQTFARFVSEFAQRYGDRLHFYQVWDEPNIAPYWGNRHIEPLGYAQLLRVASQSIRSADADAVIIAAALAPTRDRGHLGIDEVYFLQRLYAAGAAAYFDAVAIQPFGFGYSPTQPRQSVNVLNFQRSALIRQTMLAAGDEATPLWAVRYGWNRHPNSPWATVTAADQQRFSQEAITFARTHWPWLVAMGWVIDQPDAPPDDPRWGFVLDEEARVGLGRTATGETKPNTGESSASLWVTLFGLLCPFLIVWRMSAAIQLLPWQHWNRQYLNLPAFVRMGVWLALLLIYHLATWPPLILLCWVGAALVILVRPVHGLWLVAVTLPFYFQHKEIQLVDWTFTVAPALAATLCLIPAIRRHCVTVSPYHPVIFLAGTWLVLNLFSAVNVWHWPAYLGGFLELVFAPLLLCLALGLFAADEKERRDVVVALFFGGTIAAALGLWGWRGGVGVEVDGVLRLTGAYFSPNHLALYLVRTLFLGVGLMFEFRAPSGKVRASLWLLLACNTLVMLALLLTTSRGALLLGIPAGIAALMWAGRRWWPSVIPTLQMKRKGWIVIISIGLLLAALTLIIGWPRLSNSATVAERLNIWAATLRLWQDFPLFGVGPGGFFWRYPAYWIAGTESDPNLLHPHNVWLEFGANWGVVGLMWLLWVVWRVVKIGAKIANQKQPISWVEIGCLAGLVAGFAHAQVDAFMALLDVALWNWIAVVLLLQKTIQVLKT